MELWVCRASLGRLVNLAEQAPQALRGPHIQVRVTLFPLIYGTACLASLPREGTRTHEQRSALGLTQKLPETL